MIAIFLIAFGAFGDHMIMQTKNFCDCYRSDWSGSVCLKIKPADFDPYKTYGCAAK